MLKGSILAVFLLSIWCGYAYAQPPNIYTFSGDADVGAAALGWHSSGQHYIGARGDTVYVVWQGAGIRCAKSTDGGQTFTPPVTLAYGYNPSMRLDTAGIIYVAYQDDFADIRFSKSTDGGTTFTSGLKVNDDSIPEVGQEKPAIAVNNKGQIFIAWNDQRTAPGQPHRAIFATASYDGGQTFAPNVQINDGSTPIAVGLDIAATNDGDVYIAWGSYYDTLYVSRSSDSGASYFSRVPVSDIGYNLSLAAADNILGIAWDVFGNAPIRFSISYDFGQTFSTSVVVSDTGYQDPSLNWADGIFYLSSSGRHLRPSGGSRF